MSAFTYMDPEAALVIEQVGDGSRPARVLHASSGGKRVSVPLTPEILRQLGYHAALYYREQTGKAAFFPRGFTPIEPVSAEEDLIG